LSGWFNRDVTVNYMLARGASAEDITALQQRIDLVETGQYAFTDSLYQLQRFKD